MNMIRTRAVHVIHANGHTRFGVVVRVKNVNVTPSKGQCNRSHPRDIGPRHEHPLAPQVPASVLVQRAKVRKGKQAFWCRRYAFLGQGPSEAAPDH
jgi:hypothetical protein